MSRRLAEKLRVLRDEILDTGGLEGESTPGSEVFDAIISLLATDNNDGGLDLSLHEALSRRLAWGEAEAAVLADADQVVSRTVTAVSRSLRDLRDETEAIRAATSVGVAAARIVSLAAAGRAARERTALRREEATKKRLEDALQRQDELRKSLREELDAFSRADKH